LAWVLYRKEETVSALNNSQAKEEKKQRRGRKKKDQVINPVELVTEAQRNFGLNFQTRLANY